MFSFIIKDLAYYTEPRIKRIVEKKVINWEDRYQQ